MKRILPLLLALSWPQAAQAGAWTQEDGKAQIISGSILSEADRTFGDPGPISFQRELFQTYAEYGWSKDLTLIAEIDMATVGVAQNGGAAFHDSDNAFSAGMRWDWNSYFGWSDWGVFSLEASYRVAGAFNFAISANRSTGGQGAELRLLYGRNFRWLDRDGFVNVELAHDFLSGARPDETPVDVSAGLWVAENHQLLLQSFNLFAAAGHPGGYPAFNSHKLQVSWIYRWSPRTLYQLGAFFSPMGNNALVEQGVAFSIWQRF